MAKKAEAKRGQRGHSANMVVLAEHDAFAKGFDALFAAGMELTDKVSRIFGAERGADSALALGVAASPAFYERERKRLGALVLQIAAWLWLERAKRERDLSAEKVAAEKKKLALRAPPAFLDAESAESYAAQFAALPQAYRDLSAEAEYFIDRIHHMDKETKPFSASLRRQNLNPVTLHWQSLHQAFGGKK